MSASLAPSQIFVCRHGARLDASDSSWHLTSPTPYDPPLTFGGWTQARSLGNRIAAHIVSQISSEHPVASTPAAKPAEKAAVWSAGGKEGKKDITVLTTNTTTPVSKSAASKLANTKIVIHTSPFLRCVQTSIAVTAGMSQYFSDVAVKNAENLATAPDKLAVHPRPMLRIDGFLSEWLCEDYFADISPPPASDLMIGTAKIDLMRPSSAGGMRKEATLPAPSTHVHQRAHSVGFVPPVPSSAVGKNEPIPRGHVSHARDFLDIDYAYDSLRYGDGGEYGEEWGRMHKRVKIGFGKIIKDYVDGEVKPCLKNSSHTSHVASQVTSFEQLASATAAAQLKDGVKCTDSSTDGGDDTPGSTVIIFISHGAICNALIGAMTNQPVLMDMGIASLTMGVLAPAVPSTLSPSPPPRQSTPSFQLPGFNAVSADDPDIDDLSFSQKSYAPYAPPSVPSSTAASSIPTYDVKILASTEHLRPPASAVKSPQQGGNSGGTGARGTPPLRPRKPSVGGSGFSMYNTIGKLPAPLIGSANAPDNTGGGNIGGMSGTGLLPAGRAMGMVFGNSGGHAMGVRRTASAAAATKGLWSLPAAAEMERGSSDEGAVLTDEDSGEERKEEQLRVPTVERKGSVSGGMWGGAARAQGKPSGLWNSDANMERRRQSTVTKPEEGA
ncbi:hypothetical protein Dda_8869 [Drechslerella dactyloides]|uniref:Phosphoglycerate mutase family protein n=1 Tax=Drechslerella dactyloides TaxID=74499 RepID=A0AAD6IR78_DREDA|nr:hypothetical protein Dda_8869 [Drechslerella dactyloides]